jgi:hypothetical protein
LAGRIEAAKSEAVEYHLNLLHKAAPDDPKISMWFLERRRPKGFSKPEVQIDMLSAWESGENALFLMPQEALPLPKIALCEGELVFPTRVGMNRVVASYL